MKTLYSIIVVCLLVFSSACKKHIDCVAECAMCNNNGMMDTLCATDAGKIAVENFKDSCSANGGYITIYATDDVHFDAASWDKGFEAAEYWEGLGYECLGAK